MRLRTNQPAEQRPCCATLRFAWSSCRNEVDIIPPARTREGAEAEAVGFLVKASRLVLM